MASTVGDPTRVPLVSARARRGDLIEGNRPAERRGHGREPALDAADQHLRTAITALGEGRPERARMALQRAARLAPMRADIHRTLGRACLLLDDTEQARDALGRAVELDGDPEAAFLLGTMLIDEGALDAARTLIGGPLRRRPGDPRLLTVLGGCQALERQWTHAEDTLRAAVARDGELLEARLYLGLVCAGRGRHREALRWLGPVLEADRDLLRGWRTAAVCLEALDYHREATRAWREVVRLAPAAAEGRLRLGALLARQGRGHEALHQLQRAAELSPDAAEPEVELARLMSAFGRPSRAVDHFERALARGPADSEVLADAAGAWFATHRASRAHDVLGRRVHAGSPPRLLAAWASTCVRVDRPADALPALRRSLESARTDPERSTLYRALGDLLDAIGETDGAFACYQRAQDLVPATWDALGHRRDVRDLVRRASASSFSSWPRGSSTSELPVLVVGPPGSGARVLVEMLAHVPGVAIARPAERPGGPPDRPIGPIPSTAGLDRLAHRYLEALQGAALPPDNASAPFRIVDPGPHDAFHLGIAALALPRARILQVVRDPVDTAWSWYRRPRATEHPWVRSLDDLGTWLATHQALMEHWRRTLQVPWHTVRYEDLARDPQASLEAILGFLGMPPVFPRDALWGLEPRSIGRAQPYQAHLEPLITRLAGGRPTGDGNN